ncbi:MAG TPA: nuclear transport factor 2 family protein [Pyrinomonadaceae bacterium]|jgi:ketosteroid isomerase-like protein
MNKLIFTLIIVLLFALTASGQTSGGKIADKIRREVIETIERLADAGIKRDARTIDVLYAEDYLHTDADGSLMTKADVLKSYRAPTNVKIESSTHEDDRIQFDGDTAVVNTKVLYKGRAGNESFSRLYRVTYVLKKKKHWLIIASHASLIMN